MARAKVKATQWALGKKCTGPVFKAEESHAKAQRGIIEIRKMHP
jgi:hypothetical protein